MSGDVAASGTRFCVDWMAAPPAEALAAEWRELEARSDGSFFVSWHWIGRWRAALPPSVDCRLLRVREGSAVVGLALLCVGRRTRMRIVTSRALFLHATGDDALDELTIEYNGMLARRGVEREVLAAALAELSRDPSWDEVYLDGFGEAALVPERLPDGAVRVTERHLKYRYVDLEALRRSARPYTAMMTRDMRSKMKRSRAAAEAVGPLAFVTARDASEARSFLDGLRALHQKTWRARGKPGAFATPFFAEFHERLVSEAFAEGVVQLGRLDAGGTTLGYLYCFLYRGRVYVYQTGFDFSLGEGTNWRPGLVCHVFAIEHNAALGMSAYDLMAGEGRYKRELASESGEMDWLVLQRPRLGFRVHALLRAARRRLRADAAT